MFYLIALIIIFCTAYYYYRQYSRIQCFSRKALEYFGGKTVCITGASSGLGKEIARILYRHGAQVILASRRTDELNKVKQEFMASDKTKYEPVVMQLDLSSIEQTESVAKKLAEQYDIDIVVNNAGISCRNQALDTIIDVDQRMFNINFFSNITFTRTIMKSILESAKDRINSKQILVISSIQDRIALPFRSSYSSVKHALRAWYDSLRSELSLISNGKIKISLMSPAYIRTNLSLNSMTSDGTNYGRMDKTTATGYAPEYVAQKSVEMLLNDDAEMILAPFIYRLMVIIRVICPNLYFFIMKIYAKKKQK